MKIQASALAKELGLAHQGADPVLTGVRSLEDAGPGDLSYLADKRYLDALAASSAGAIIAPPEFADKADCVLVSQNPQLDAVRAMHAFARPQGEQQGVSPQAFVSDSAVLGPGCAIYPFAYIGPRAEVGEGTAIFPGCYVGEDCRIGKNCVLYPNVALMAGTELGDNVTIHPSVAVGGDGFGYVPTPMGIQKIPHLGRVVIGDNVEIGALTAVDRGSLRDTRIGSGTKIDNLVQVAHNVQVGGNCLFAGQVGVSGSAVIGNGVILAGQVGVAQHISIGDGATLGPQSGVGKDVPAGATMGGTPAMERGTFLRSITLTPKYPEMYRTVQKMEKRLAELERRLESGEKQ